MANPILIYCLVLALCTISTSADVFVSIDSGSSTASYTDENGIVWTGDDNFTRNGESRSVQSSSSVSRVMDTLRVFTTQKKNCYDIDSVKRGRVLVRATFNYGNYDNKSSPPTFDLLFDGNHWDTVRTTNVGAVWREVIYNMKGDRISVCVAQTNPGEFPFVSAVEVRVLEFKYKGDDSMDLRYPLLLSKRVAFGSNATIRYKEDPYDRIWSPERVKGYVGIPSDAPFEQAIIWNDSPPPAVLKNAITTPTPNGSSVLLGLQNIVLPMGFPRDEVTAYILWHFSEVTQLQPNQTRSFEIFLNNKSFSNPILPPYNNCSVMYITNFTVSSKDVFSLVPTNVSTLPPLINAMEVFLHGDELSNGTDTKDVQGLGSLQEAFDVLQGWSGDPCFPAPYAWDWIDCTPRVTALLLGSFGLSGLLPDFSSMNALQTIDLHNNTLRGRIPDFLGNFPNLKVLNLSNNQLNGTIPASLSSKKGLTLVVTGNPDLCTSSTSCQTQLRGPPASSSINLKKNILEVLFSSIISSVIILPLMR
ncbi:hypothetical protein ACS0TY_014999 [Phlomoides rotata]